VAQNDFVGSIMVRSAATFFEGTQHLLLRHHFIGALVASLKDHNGRDLLKVAKSHPLTLTTGQSRPTFSRGLTLSRAAVYPTLP
jgi:hypothetical protein